jgi:TolB-like protein/Flp pilus assembly protein TadD
VDDNQATADLATRASAKVCPACGELYYQNSLRYCRQDGSLLTTAPGSAESSETLVLPSRPPHKPAPPFNANERTFTHRSRVDSSSFINSLAVLPLTNDYSDPSGDYLSDGITETLINMVSQVQELRVVPRSTVFRYKASDVDPQECGRQLGVRAVLTGRVQQIGDTLTIQADLIDVVNEAQLWGQRYRRQMTDIFDLQEEIANEIFQKLRVRLTSEQEQRLRKRQTDNTEAYQAYLKGRYYWNKRTEEGLRTSTKYFHQAVDIDPCYAQAYAGLADSYAVQGIAEYGLLLPTDAMPRAKAAAAKALEIDDTLVEAQTTLAHVTAFYDWDWTRAEQEFRRAVELDPKYALCHHWYACYLAAVGRHGDALVEETNAQQIDPLSLVINKNLGTVLYYAGELEQSITQYKKALELEPSFVRTHIYLGLSYVRSGMYSEAIVEYQEAVKISGEGSVLMSLIAYANALNGDRNAASDILRSLLDRSQSQYIPAFNFALICVGLGEIDLAFEWLNKAVEERSSWLVSLNVEPMLEPLRADPRFAELLLSVGLPVN